MSSTHGPTPPHDFDAFARWALGAVVVNTHRGLYAEWLVANALGGTPFREEWAACDVLTPDLLTVEVKCTGMVQAWEPSPGRKRSSPQFDITAKKRWLGHGNAYTDKPAIVAATYVFALHTCTDKTAYNVGIPEQWQFYVTSGRAVDNWPQKTSITLSVLDKTPGVAKCSLDALADTARSVADAPDAASQINWAAHLLLPQHAPVTDNTAR